MPWTAKQLKLFRAAAHNPAIAKSSGIKQADAERMSKEGLKKMAGGGKALINRQDTRHGKMDMPYKKLNRFAGMKEGGVMKKRRFYEGGDAGSLEDEGFTKEGEGEDTVYRKSFVSTPSYKKETKKPTTKSAAISVAKSVKNKKASDYGDEGDRMRARQGDYDDMFKGISRASRLMRRDDEAGIKQTVSESGDKKSSEIKFSSPLQRLRERMSSGDQQAFRPRDRGFRKGGAIMRSKKDIGKDQMSMAPYKKGGEMESKAMMKKEIGFMQKKGAPASMIKHEKAEMKGMARGGGIESRGKTKGTMIKMAAGGSVRAYGEHSIQKKGHTRGKMC